MFQASKAVERDIKMFVGIPLLIGILIGGFLLIDIPVEVERVNAIVLEVQEERNTINFGTRTDSFLVKVKYSDGNTGVLTTGPVYEGLEFEAIKYKRRVSGIVLYEYEK
tara:strand:- start:153 stop:479 length:327 start_codon:yes stop_codon:yes gene_type:complete